MRKPLVSVLMVTYNRESLLKETIASVLNQTYDNLQFIIVDDGSTDESCKVIESFHDDRIELYRLKENRHICHATNYGFSKVKGEYLARIDSDDVWYPEKIAKQLEFLENNDEYKICFTGADMIDGNSKCINEKEEHLLRLFETEFADQKESLYYFFTKGNCLSHPSVLMETEVMRKVGGFNPSYVQLHDFEYWVRIAKHYPIHVMKEKLLAMRRFGDEDSTDNNSSFRNRVNHIRSYNEIMDIRRHFFDDMTDELFVATFKTDFINKEASSKEELECEKAFLLCRPILNSTVMSAAGVERLYDLMLDPEVKKVLEEKYAFTEKSMYELTKTSIYFDMTVEEEISKKDKEIEKLSQKIAELSQLNEQLHHEIGLYSNSLSWKITDPLRKISGMVRGRH